MTDREEFEKFLKDNFLYDTSGFIQNEAERKKAQDESFVWRAWQARGELDKAFAETQEADLSKCPKCGGEADNGHDRCIPPSPYYCTKCNETQEPMIIKQENGMVLKLGYEDLPNGTAFYTTPSREWVGLSDDEILRLEGLDCVDEEYIKRFARAIEAKLREKNNA